MIGSRLAAVTSVKALVRVHDHVVLSVEIDSTVDQIKQIVDEHLIALNWILTILSSKKK